MMPFAVRTRPRLDTCCCGRFAAPSPTLEGRSAGGAEPEGRLQFVRRVSLSAARSQQPTARAVALPTRRRTDNRIAQVTVFLQKETQNLSFVVVVVVVVRGVVSFAVVKCTFTRTVVCAAISPVSRNSLREGPPVSHARRPRLPVCDTSGRLICRGYVGANLSCPSEEGQEMRHIYEPTSDRRGHISHLSICP